MKFFNTLGRKIQDFEPDKKSAVNLYSCGPTVYAQVHIGNLRAFIFADILKRALEFNNFDVNWTMNITDIDDKTINNTIKEFGAQSTPEDLIKFTSKFTLSFLDDLKKVNIDEQDVSFVKVTEKIADIQLYILQLVKKGFGYKAEDGSTYFSIEKYQQAFGDYGALVGEKFLEGKKIGARVKVDEYEKDDLSDFALWKAHGPDDANIFWDHPDLGPGRPGWHIECTLINYLKFPEGTNIHTGGVDLVFPHHTNEIAQAQPIYKPFVRYWMHNEHILVDDKKMAKRLGNFYTLADLEKMQISGLDLRYLYLQSHYRSKLNVTKESLFAAKNGLLGLRKQVGDIISDNTNNTDAAVDPKYLKKFTDALNEDLNTPEALSVLFEVFRSDLRPAIKLATVLKMDEALGLDLERTFISQPKKLEEQQIPSDLKKLLEQRSQAKKQKDFTTADQIRTEIEARGFEITDGPEGQDLRKK